MSHDWTLVIGNKNYSSWSLRAWLALTEADIPFEEELIWLDTATSQAAKLRHGPTGRVPVLHAGELTIPDSLAICEFAAESFPERGLWPAERGARARARALCAEVHASYWHLRRDLPMNCRARHERKPRRPEVERDVQRVLQSWRDTRQEFGEDGPFLFGKFSIADAFAAPIASRFFTYDVELDAITHAYQTALFSLPSLQRWMLEAEREPKSLPRTDAIT